MVFWKNFYLPLWIRGNMTVEQLQQAVTKGRITLEEMEEIIATPQNVQFAIGCNCDSSINILYHISY